MYEVWKKHDRISIHAPNEGCDGSWEFYCADAERFQSTHPTRGATQLKPCPFCGGAFQSTHPTRGATYYEEENNG